jgi:hypothetical protein
LVTRTEKPSGVSTSKSTSSAGISSAMQTTSESEAFDSTARRRRRIKNPLDGG